jgi:hypothetical protein
MSNESALTLDDLRGEGRVAGMCKFHRIYLELSPENKKVVLAAIMGGESDFPSGRIANVLSNLGHLVSTDTVIKHRRGRCRCATIEEIVHE